MPGKVNPVIPEVVNQVAFNIIGNDMTITMAAEAGQLELNAFEPIVFYCLFQSIDTLGYAVHTFVDNCVMGITATKTAAATWWRTALASSRQSVPMWAIRKPRTLPRRPSAPAIPSAN